jgi:hypothetical protein
MELIAFSREIIASVGVFIEIAKNPERVMMMAILVVSMCFESRIDWLVLKVDLKLLIRAFACTIHAHKALFLLHLEQLFLTTFVKRLILPRKSELWQNVSWSP